MNELWYPVTSVVFGVALYFPLRKFMFALNANRATRKKGSPLTEEEMSTLRKKNNIVAAIISVTFAFIYNKIVMIKFFGGVGG